MKTKLFRYQGVLIGLLAAGLVIAGHSGRASAATATTQPSSPKPTTAYTYVAQPGDNLSIMVRRSVQLYAQAKQIELTPAAAMYCETNTVQKLGAHLLDVGEKVSVPFATLQSYMATSRKLTPAQSAAWRVFANRASFNLGSLNPVNKAKAQAAALPHSSSASTKKPSNSESNKSTGFMHHLRWYGWIAVAGFILATGYYFTRFKS